VDDPMTELNAEQARRAIVEHTRRLAESAAAAGPHAAVPTTPEWTIADLVEHVGQTQHWVLNETVVHGFDAANAAGRPADIDADIAAALISNHLAMLTSPAWEMQRSESARAIRGTGQTLQWLATDTVDDAGAWFVERRPDGARWQPRSQQADVTVSGPARSLLLILTRRLPLTDREATDTSVDGDTDLAQHWIDNTAHVSD
jgi:hypothetical protein